MNSNYFKIYSLIKNKKIIKEMNLKSILLKRILKNAPFLLLLVFFLTLAPGARFEARAQEKKETTAKSTDDGIFKKENFQAIDDKKVNLTRIYEEITLEDFENNNYTNANMGFQYTRVTSAGIMIRDEYPAPIYNSKKYLGVKVFGQKGDIISVFPAKPIVIDKFCKTFSIWAYGKGLSGYLSVIFTDSNQNTQRLQFGYLNYHGWRKLTVTLPPSVLQQDQYLNQQKNLKIFAIIFNPGNTLGGNKWNYLYLDDFTASVREKYSDRQSDTW
jgi:hypothetical protein